MEKVSRKDLQAEAEKLGLKFNTKTTISEFEEMIKKAEQANARKVKAEDKKVSEEAEKKEEDKGGEEDKEEDEEKKEDEDTENAENDSQEDADEDSDESEEDPEEPSVLFNGQKVRKSGNLRSWEKDNHFEVVEVFADRQSATDLHCKVLDRKNNVLTMHVPKECFTNLPNPRGDDEE